jgi:hypothetical protein
MDIDAVFLNRVIPEEGLYVYNISNIVKKHFSISIESVRSRGGSLVILSKCMSIIYVACDRGR